MSEIQSSRVVVGVDGTAGSRLALGWALEEAAHRGAEVQAIATWHWEAIEPELLRTSGHEDARVYTATMLDEEVDKALAGWTENPPHVRREVVEGRPDEALVAASEGAAMLVVGSHGHSRLRHAALGSVSERCIRHATSPVVVLPLPHH